MATADQHRVECDFSLWVFLLGHISHNYRLITAFCDMCRENECRGFLMTISETKNDFQPLRAKKVKVISIITPQTRQFIEMIFCKVLSCCSNVLSNRTLL